MQDAITIALLLALAAVVPLLIRFFINTAESFSPDPPLPNDDNDDGDDSMPADDWPSIIEVTDLEILPKPRLEIEHGVDLHCQV